MVEIRPPSPRQLVAVIFDKDNDAEYMIVAVVVLRITIICHNQHLIDIVAIDVVAQLGFGWSAGIISKFLINCLNAYKILGLGNSVKVVVSVVI